MRSDTVFVLVMPVSVKIGVTFAAPENSMIDTIHVGQSERKKPLSGIHFPSVWSTHLE